MYLAQVVPVLPPASGAGAETATHAASTTESLHAALVGALGTFLPKIAAIILSRAILVAGVLVVGWLAVTLAYLVIKKAGSRVLAARLGRASRSRAVTLADLFYSIAKYVIYFTVFVAALKCAGVDPTPFLGGAAIVGLAVSFGSQDLVKDFVTGISLLLEDQFSVGEYVELGGKGGIVVSMSIRSVTIRDAQGVLNNIPYRTVTVVTNTSRTTAVLNMDVFLADDAGEAAAPAVLEKTLASLVAELSPFLRSSKLVGVINPGTPYRAVRATLDVMPGRVDFVQGEVAERVRKVFAAESIAIAGDKLRFFNKPGVVAA